MEFSEIKMIWDAQNQEPLYALNEAALRGIVQRKTREINRCISRCYLREIMAGLGSGALMLVCAAWLAASSRIKVAVTSWESLVLFLASGIWLYYSAYMYLARRRQLRREETFESTLRGDIERALAQTEFQVAMARNIVWWGLVPVWVASAIWVVTLFHLVATPVWAYVLMGSATVGSLVVVVSGRQRAITVRYEPRRRELESLRAKLVDPQH